MCVSVNQRMCVCERQSSVCVKGEAGCYINYKSEQKKKKTTTHTMTHTRNQSESTHSCTSLPSSCKVWRFSHGVDEDEEEQRGGVKEEEREECKWVIVLTPRPFSSCFSTAGWITRRTRGHGYDGQNDHVSASLCHLSHLHRTFSVFLSDW